VDCRSVFERLSADLDGELAATEAAAVRRHILSCADCARQRTLLEKTRRAFRSIAPEPIGRGFDDQLVRGLRETPVLGRWLAAAAGLAAVLGFVVLRNPARPASVTGSAPLAASRSASDISAAPSPDVPPGWRDGRVDAGADCGLSGTVVCRVDTPCRDRPCPPTALVDVTRLTRSTVAMTNTR
jgi:anti-sigma factor RsiW